MTERITFAGTVTREGRNVSGFVQLAGSRTFRNGEWVSVDPAALVKANASDVIARFNHDPEKMLGRTANGTLTLERTDQGIGYQITNLPETTAANDTLALLDGGYITGSSFEIGGKLRSSFSTDPDGSRVRTYTSIERLVDVSPVIDPAFPSTAAAFGKDHSMPGTDTDTQDDAPPAPPAVTTGTATFTAAPVATDDITEVTTRFAQTLDRPRIEAAMDSLFTESGGHLTGNILTEYKALAAVHAAFAKAEIDASDEAARISRTHDMRLGRSPKAPAASETFASRDYLEAFDTYLRTGKDSQMQQFAQAIAGDGTQGGYTVPDGFLTRIGERIKAFGGIAGIADEITTTSGEPLRWPYLDDTANTAVIAAEGSAAGSAGADLVFDTIALGAYSYDATGTGNAPLKVSLELLQDSAFDIAGLVERKLGERLGRKQAADLATANGSGAPEGLLNKTPDAMTATVVTLAAPEHIFQVDSAYRDGGNCRWVMSDTILARVWTAQTTTNQPLFIPGGSDIVGRPGASLYGYPITIDSGAGVLVAFGDIRAGYIIRRVRGVQVLVDPYTAQSTRQVAYHAWARMDAAIQDPNAYSVSSWTSVTADT